MVSVRRRALIAAALGVTMLAAPVALWAARGVVVRKDGRINAGEIVADDDAGITLQIADIDLFIPRQDIASVKYQKTVAEQYLQRRAKLADDDLDSRYELAKWLLENKAFDLALKEVDQLLQRFVTDSRLEILKRTSLAQRDLAHAMAVGGRERISLFFLQPVHTCDVLLPRRAGRGSDGHDLGVGQCPAGGGPGVGADPRAAHGNACRREGL